MSAPTMKHVIYTAIIAFLILTTATASRAHADPVGAQIVQNSISYEVNPA